MIKVLFFAQIRERLDCAQVDISTDKLSTAPSTIAELKTLLAQRGDLWRLMFAEQQVLSAINKVMSTNDSPIQAGDEVAFFPPVTGG
ncbi:MAG: MoaD/ThiS family protein [Porticoccaceae bacterium]